MAYNGGIRFTPDVYYEIKEDGGDITVLRNGEEIGGDSYVLEQISIFKSA